MEFQDVVVESMLKNTNTKKMKKMVIGFNLMQEAIASKAKAIMESSESCFFKYKVRKGRQILPYHATISLASIPLRSMPARPIASSTFPSPSLSRKR